MVSILKLQKSDLRTCKPSALQGLLNLFSATGASLLTQSLTKERKQGLPGLLRNQGEKSINFYFIIVPVRKKY